MAPYRARTTDDDLVEDFRTIRPFSLHSIPLRIESERPTLKSIVEGSSRPILRLTLNIDVLGLLPFRFATLVGWKNFIEDCLIFQSRWLHIY